MDFGNINLKYRSYKTYCGVDFDLAKSALQKYIRRGQWELACEIMADLDLFEIVVNNEQIYSNQNLLEVKTVHRSIKSVRTNILNRLSVIASEDIGIANNNAAEVVYGYKQTFDKIKTRRLQLIRLIVYLARSPKLRLISDFKTLFMLPPYYWKNRLDKTKYLEMHNYLKSKFSFMNPTVVDFDWRTALNNNDVFHFFYYLGQDMLSESDPDRIMKQLNSILPDSSLKRTYNKMSHAEKPIYLYHASMIQMGMGQSIDVDVSDIDEKYVDSLYKKILETKAVTIHDYCKDVHTKSGRNHSSVVDFALAGSYSTNCYLDYYNQKYRLLYILFKILIDERDYMDLASILLKYSSQIQQVVPQCPDNIYLYLIKDVHDIKKIIPKKIKKIIPKKIKPKKIKKIIPRKSIPREIIGINCVNETSKTTETDLFQLIARAQINTTSSRTDVYFATTNRDFSMNGIFIKKTTRLVVKGPYLDDSGPEYAIKMNQIKKDAGLPYNEICFIMYLVPDRWNDLSTLGVRYSLKEKNGPYPFLIARDYLQAVKLPIRLKSPTKKWSATEVVDFSQLEKYYWNPVKMWSGLSDQNKANFVYLIIFRYFMNLGDMADRNFIFVNDTIYSLDEDTPKKDKLSHPLVLLKKQRFMIVSNWIKDNSDLVANFVERLSKLLSDKYTTGQVYSTKQVFDLFC